MSTTSWVQLLQEATGWSQPRRAASWTRVEAALGTALPADYKELCESFEPGAFSGFLSLLRGDEAEPVWSLESALRHRVPAGGIGEMIGTGNAGGTGGGARDLVAWGRAEPEIDLYWLPEPWGDPDAWPVVARRDPLEPPRLFAMTTVEFVYRAVADPEFGDFSSQVAPAFYLPAWRTIRTAEEWERVLHDRPRPRDRPGPPD